MISRGTKSSTRTNWRTASGDRIEHHPERYRRRTGRGRGALAVAASTLILGTLVFSTLTAAPAAAGPLPSIPGVPTEIVEGIEKVLPPAPNSPAPNSAAPSTTTPSAAAPATTTPAVTPQATRTPPGTVTPSAPAGAQTPSASSANAGEPLSTPVAAPVLTVTPTTGLTGETTVRVTGSGYRANYALYLAQTIDRPLIGFPLVYANEAKVTTDKRGNFSTTLTVSPTFKNVECRRQNCFVATFAAFPNIFLDRSQDVWRRVSFTANAKTSITPTTSAPSSGRPTVKISKVRGIDPAGERLKISGTGFSGAGSGIYVGIAAVNRYNPFDADSFGATEWIRATAIRGGAWSAELDVKAVFGATDCRRTQCAIYTLAAHGSPDRSQDTRTLVYFDSASAGGTTVPAAPTTTTPAAPAGSAPSVAVSKTTGLNAAGDTVTVSGSGFSGAGAGIYVGIADTARFSPTDQSAFGPDTKFIRSSQMSGGSWSTTLNVSAAFGSTNCTRSSCAIYTLAAHGSSDRSQDTSTPVSFTGTAENTEDEDDEASNGTPVVAVSKTTDVADGATVTVSGTGFSGKAPGIYVGLVPDESFSVTNADAWGATTYITPAQITDGTWSTQLTLNSTIGSTDCTKVTCSIRTVMAHGSADRSQDTKTVITFAAGTPSTTPATSPSAAPSTTPASATPAAAGNDGNDSGSSVVPWAVGGVAALVVGTAAAAVVARRRRN